MTAPSHRPAPRYSSPPDPDRTFDLATVRRVDVRRLAREGWPDAELPPVHGAERDPRYPSPRSLRRFWSFLIDLLLHVTIAIGVAIALALRMDPGIALLIGIGAFFGASIVDRIVLQRLCHATIGKLLTGLRVIRDDTGGSPTTWSLIKEWFASIVVVLSLMN